MPNKNTFKYITACIIYGTIGLLLQYVNASSEFVVLCRGTIGSMFILLVLFLRKEKIDKQAIRKNFKYLVLSGVCLGFNWVFLFAGYKRALALTSLVNYTAPIMVVIITSIIGKEKFSGWNILFILTSFIGVVFISGIFNSSGIDFYCMACGFIAALGFVGLVLCNRKFKEIKPLDKTVIQLAFSALTVLPYVIFNHGFPESLDSTSLLIIVVLGIVHTGIAYILYFSSVGLLPVSKVAILGYIEPALNVIIGISLLNEDASVFSIVGAILIILSAIASETMNSRK